MVWLIAWILEPGEDYHDRDFEGLSDNMKENALLKTLIQEGLGVKVRGGSMCFNHPELVHKPPTHLAISVLAEAPYTPC